MPQVPSQSRWLVIKAMQPYQVGGSFQVCDFSHEFLAQDHL